MVNKEWIFKHLKNIYKSKKRKDDPLEKMGKEMNKQVAEKLRKCLRHMKDCDTYVQRDTLKTSQIHCLQWKLKII